MNLRQRRVTAGTAGEKHMDAILQDARAQIEQVTENRFVDGAHYEAEEQKNEKQSDGNFE